MVLLAIGTLKLHANIYQVRSYQAVPKKICTNFEPHTNLCEVSAYHVVAAKVYQLCDAYRAAPARIPEDPSTDPLSSLNVPLRLSHCRLEAAIGSGAPVRRWRGVFEFKQRYLGHSQSRIENACRGKSWGLFHFLCKLVDVFHIPYLILPLAKFRDSPKYVYLLMVGYQVCPYGR